MSKRKGAIISISIISAILLLFIILFGVVFRLHHQNVIYLDDVGIGSEDIVKAGGLKNGRSTLFLNTDEARENIEKAYPFVKVVQISIKSAITIEITVTSRHQMFYYRADKENCFILDEDLKVLTKSSAEQDLEGLIEIDKTILDSKGELVNQNFLGINNNTQLGEFVGDSYYQSVVSSLYVSVYRSVLVDEAGELWLGQAEGNKSELLDSGEIRYCERQDMGNFIKMIEFVVGNKDKDYHRLVITTKYGVKIDIAQPETDLLRKVNLCFDVVSQLDNDADETTSSASGKVVVEYDDNWQERAYYLAN